MKEKLEIFFGSKYFWWGLAIILLGFSAGLVISEKIIAETTEQKAALIMVGASIGIKLMMGVKAHSEKKMMCPDKCVNKDKKCDVCVDSSEYLEE